MATVAGHVPIIHNGRRISAGPRLYIRGLQARAELGASRDGRLVLGARVFINQGVNIWAQSSVSIGDDAKLADFVAISDTNFHDIEPGAPVTIAAVTIGVNVWIGRSAIVLPGVTIGDHAVVGAGSVVSGHVAASTLVGGNPARLIRELSRDERWRRS